MIKNLFFVERDDEGIYFDKQGKSRSIDLVKGMSELRNEITPIEARALADAIYNDLGLGWLPYPENKPEDAKEYFIYTKNIKKASQVFYAQWSVTKDAWLSPFGGLIEDEYCKVIAYMEIPTYQPEDSHDQ